MLFQKTQPSCCKCWVINGEPVVALTLSCAVELYAEERKVEITDELMATIRNPSKNEADAAFVFAESGMAEFRLSQLKAREEEKKKEIERQQQEEREREKKRKADEARIEKAKRFHSFESIAAQLRDFGYNEAHTDSYSVARGLDVTSKQLVVQVGILRAIDKLIDKIDKLPSRIATAIASASTKQEKELLKQREKVAKAEFKAAAAKVAAINARPALLVTMSNDEIEGEFEGERVVESW